MAVEFYRYSLRTAKSENLVDLYNDIRNENRRCRDYVEDEKTGYYANAYKNNCVDSDGSYTRSLIEKFGLERVLNMYAVTIKAHKHDSRISKELHEWAKNFNVGLRAGEDVREESLLTTMNPGAVDLLAKHAISEFEKLNLFTREHCEDELGDFEGKVVVISHKHLREKYWSPENQLWLATAGFGCYANKTGQAVSAICLIDDDRNEWRRQHVVGVLKEEFLPDWAKEKLQELQVNKQSEEQNQDNEINLV